MLGVNPATADDAWRAQVGIVLQSWRDHAKWRVRELLDYLGDFYAPYSGDVQRPWPIDDLLARTLTIDAGPGIAKSQRKIRTWLIWNADAVRDVLAPFDSGVRAAPSGDNK